MDDDGIDDEDDGMMMDDDGIDAVDDSDCDLCFWLGSGAALTGAASATGAAVWVCFFARAFLWRVDIVFCLLCGGEFSFSMGLSSFFLFGGLGCGRTYEILMFKRSFQGRLLAAAARTGRKTRDGGDGVLNGHGGGGVVGGGLGAGAAADVDG